MDDVVSLNQTRSFLIKTTKNARYWSDEDSDRFIQYIKDGLSNDYIRNNNLFPGKDKRQIQRKRWDLMSKLKTSGIVVPYVNSNYVWTQQEDELMSKMLLEGKNNRQIYDSGEFKDKTYRQITDKAKICYDTLLHLGVVSGKRATSQNVFTNKETEQLKEMLLQKKTYRDIFNSGIFKGRTYKQITHKCSELYNAMDDGSIDINDIRSNRGWTTEELDFLEYAVINGAIIEDVINSCPLVLKDKNSYQISRKFNEIKKSKQGDL